MLELPTPELGVAGEIGVQRIEPAHSNEPKCGLRPFGIHGAKGTEPFDRRNAAEPRRQAVVVAS
jgi:hypothetical protein